MTPQSQFMVLAPVTPGREPGLGELVERNRDFDQDTSLGYKPDRQREWLRKVRDELAATQPYASPPYPPPS